MDEKLITEMDKLEDNTDRYRFVFIISGMECFSKPYQRESALAHWEDVKDHINLNRIQYESASDIPGGMPTWHTL